MSSDVKLKKEKKSKKSKKTKKSSKKQKKEKKSKKSKKHKHSSSGESSDSDGESSAEEKISKQKHKRKHFSDASSSESSDSESEEDAWIEKPIKNAEAPAADAKKAYSVPLERDDWMGGFSAIKTFSKESEPPKERKTEERRGIDAYDPSKCSRELNPYWKDGGSGLPSTFSKPNYDSDDNNRGDSHKAHSNRYDRGNASRQPSWRKKTENKNEPSTSSSRLEHLAKQEKYRRSRSPSKSSSSSRSRSNSPNERKPDIPAQESQSSRADFLTDQQMNELGAKLVKAEIMGNDEMVKELKEKLNRARQYRTEHKKEVISKSFERRGANHRNGRQNEDEVLLTTTNSKGVSRPVVSRTKNPFADDDMWGGKAGRKQKKQKVETHSGGERVRYFADDDRYDIKQMVIFFAYFTLNKKN